MGNWLNLDKIDLLKFRRTEGYIPPGYHTHIAFFQDANFIFPTKFIQPLNWKLTDNADILKFFNGHKTEYSIPQPKWVNKYAFLPGPGEIRPTHILFRYDLFDRQPMDTPVVFNGNFEQYQKKYQGPDFITPIKQIALKVVNPNYGYQEFRRQRDLVKKGYYTPRVYTYETYFSPLMLGLLNIINRPRHPLQGQCRWAFDYIQKLERSEKTFTEFEEETRIMIKILEALDESDETLKDNKQGRKNLARYREDFHDIDAVTDSGRKVLKGYFTMDYWGGLTSFERILFDTLGGRKLETYSHSIRLLDAPPIFNGREIVDAVVKVITDLWTLGETHNDLKGEHVVWNAIEKKWGMIDWGELVKGSPAKDLALFLADSSDFVYNRVLFNKRYLRKTFQEKYSETFDPTSPHYSKARANVRRVTQDIFRTEGLFWDGFLTKMREVAGSDVLKEAAELGEQLRKKFNWPFVREHAHN